MCDKRIRAKQFLHKKINRVFRLTFKTHQFKYEMGLFTGENAPFFYFLF